jgi:NAD(P)H-hydrate epimerase
MQILLSDAMRELEQASERLGVSCAALMQNAGQAVAAHIAEHYRPGTCAVLCGSGNNGGDGYVAAARLRELGTDAFAVAVCGEPKTPLASDACIRAREAGVPILAAGEDDARILSADVVVDAIFGTGFHGTMTGEPARLAALLADHSAVVAVDLPSGLSGNSPALPQGACFAAAETLCLETAKPAAVMLPAASRCKTVTVLPIGVPSDAYTQIPPVGCTMTEEEACALLPVREETAHKGTFGRLLLVAGSSRFRGAALMATQAALRSGVGIVTLASVEPVLAAVSAALWEATLFPLPATDAGTIRADSAALLLAESQNATAMLIGCGLGNTADTAALVARLLAEADCPLVLDADALNALADHAEWLDGAKRQPILTPHIGEMARLTGLSREEIKRDAVQIALCFAKERHCVVVLKDASTVVASPDGRFCCCRGGNAGLARGGSGDTLAGITGAFLAQGMNAFEAASAAVTLHSAAGKRCAARLSQTGMTPHELTEDLRTIFLENGR